MKSLAKLFMTTSVALLSAGACHAGTITINVWQYQWETTVDPIVYVQGEGGTSFNNNAAHNIYEFVADSSQSSSDGVGAPNETINIHEYFGGPVNNPDPSFSNPFATNVNYLGWTGGIEIPFANGQYSIVNFPLSIAGTQVTEAEMPH